MPISPAAVYMRIAENLQERIETAEFKAGDKLPSERMLSEELQVNRITIRRAFSILENKGLIKRKHGGGTFVSLPKIERQAAELVPFTLAMRQQGFQPGDKIIHIKKQTPGSSVARELQLSNTEKVYSIFRIRLINEEPALLERFFFSAKRFPYFEKYDHTMRSGYEIMSTEYGVTVVRAEQSLEPVVATEQEARLLGIKAASPLMLERRLSFDEAGKPVEFGKDLYRGDRFKFVTRMAPLLMDYSA